MFPALCAHHQEVKILLYSIWYHHTYRWPSGAQVERGESFIMSVFHASTCFEHYVLIIRRSKFYYTASGIITPIGGRPVHRLREDIKICDAKQPKQVPQYKNTKIKLYQCNAAIWYNKTCNQYLPMLT